VQEIGGHKIELFVINKKYQNYDSYEKNSQPGKLRLKKKVVGSK